ncbi:MAG TPA: hypothetical protein VGK67_05050 [Myxococcales bacterium]|jgi:hypothetical protein
MDANFCTSLADRWARRGAWLAVVSMALALLWVGFTLFQPAPASAATPRQSSGQALDNDLSTAVADAPSARSTR